MVDIHCHILPGVDDGADSMEEALEMARMAADSGVDTIVATPHCNLPGAARSNFVSDELKKRFIALREAVKVAGIPLAILPGTEVLCTPDVPEKLRQGKLLSLAGSRYLLMEFFFDESLEYMDSMLAAVKREGFTPVIAHPERYEAVQAAPAVIERWFWDGHIIQLNKGSVLGSLGQRARRCAGAILSHGLAHTIASDAHGTEMRTTHMTELQQYILDVCGEEYASILLEENPRRIIKNLPILRAD